MLAVELDEAIVRELVGAPAVESARRLGGIAPLGDYGDARLYFVNRPVSASVAESLRRVKGGVVLVRKGEKADLGDNAAIEVAAPRLALALVLRHVREKKLLPPLVKARSVAPSAQISPLALVEGDVELGAGVVIEPFAYVGPDVVLGPGAIIRSGARIWPRVTIGAGTIVGNNSVIGADGFGNVEQDGRRWRIPHLGGVVIGARVDIGALVSVAAGTVAPTRIEDDVRLDDRVLIAHNVHLKRGCSLTGASGVAGSTIVGENTWLGANAAIRDGISVGANCVIGMGSVVRDDLPDNAVTRSPDPKVIVPRRPARGLLL